MMDTNQTAAREARRFLTDRVRNDWDFPDLPAPVAGQHSDEELRGVSEFRERYYGTTDDDNDESPTEDDESEHNNDSNTGEAAAAAAAGDYKFESPEHVGARLEERGARRRRRRRRALEEEMGWNEGMAVFVRRRDAWTGAASVRKYARRRSRTSSEMEPREIEAQRVVERMLAETAVVVQDAAGDDGSTPPPPTDGETTTTMVQALDERTGRIDIAVPASEEPLVPLAPPLLSQNLIRQSVTPKAYPDIYSKIVVSGQTPKVPINLAHMTRALVQGWKDDGEWPPRPGPADPLMGRKKAAAAAAGGGRVGTLAAVLGGAVVGVGGGGGGAGSSEGKAGVAHHGEFLAHHPHLQKGVESVKKVFRLSGGTAHPSGHSTTPGGGLVGDGRSPAG